MNKRLQILMLFLAVSTLTFPMMRDLIHEARVQSAIDSILLMNRACKAARRYLDEHRYYSSERAFKDAEINNLTNIGKFKKALKALKLMDPENIRIDLDGLSFSKKVIEAGGSIVWRTLSDYEEDLRNQEAARDAASGLRMLEDVDPREYVEEPFGVVANVEPEDVVVIASQDLLPAEKTIEALVFPDTQAVVYEEGEYGHVPRKDSFESEDFFAEGTRISLEEAARRQSMIQTHRKQTWLEWVFGF